jgi:hypothetical protein
VVAGDAVYVGGEGGDQGPEHRRVPPDHRGHLRLPRQLSVAGGRVFGVHDPGDGANATLTSLAPG